MRRVVQKRADDADRRRREAKLNAEKTDAAGQAQEILEKKKAEDGERLARETKARHGVRLRDRHISTCYYWCRPLLANATSPRWPCKP